MARNKFTLTLTILPLKFRPADASAIAFTTVTVFHRARGMARAAGAIRGVKANRTSTSTVALGRAAIQALVQRFAAFAIRTKMLGVTNALTITRAPNRKRRSFTRARTGFTYATFHQSSLPPAPITCIGKGLLCIQPHSHRFPCSTSNCRYSSILQHTFDTHRPRLQSLAGTDSYHCSHSQRH